MVNSSDANTGSFDVKVPRYEELAIPKPRIDLTSNFNAFKVKRGALSYQITDSMNKLAQPKLRPNPENSEEQVKPVSKVPSAVSDKIQNEVRHPAKIPAMSPPASRTRSHKRPRQPDIGKAPVPREKLTKFL